MAEIAAEHQVTVTRPNENKVVEISTTGNLGTALPILIHDVFLCVKALIREECDLSGVELPPAPYTGLPRAPGLATEESLHQARRA